MSLQHATDGPNDESVRPTKYVGAAAERGRKSIRKDANFMARVGERTIERLAGGDGFEVSPYTPGAQSRLQLYRLSIPADEEVDLT